MSLKTHQTFNPNIGTFYRDDQCTFNTKNAFPVQYGTKEIESLIKTFRFTARDDIFPRIEFPNEYYMYEYNMYYVW
jgi:hypothetical protein